MKQQLSAGAIKDDLARSTRAKALGLFGFLIVIEENAGNSSHPAQQLGVLPAILPGR